MRHPPEGVLRRLLDEPAGVSEPDRAHVAGCPVCLAGLAAARQDAAVVDRALQPADPATVDLPAAWQRLSAALPAAAPDRAPDRAPARTRRARAVLRRPVVAALAFAVVPPVVLFMSFAAHMAALRRLLNATRTPDRDRCLAVTGAHMLLLLAAAFLHGYNLLWIARYESLAQF